MATLCMSHWLCFCCFERFNKASTYLNIFTYHVGGEINDDMSGSINQILVIGRIEFKEHIEVSIGRRIQPKLQGRSLMKKTEN